MVWSCAEAKEFVAGLGIRVIRDLTTRETLEVRWDLFHSIAMALDEPLEMTGSVQGKSLDTLLWDVLSKRHMASRSSASKILGQPGRKIIYFEFRLAPSVLVEGPMTFDSLDENDLYVICMDTERPRIVISTHESIGPFIIDYQQSLSLDLSLLRPSDA